jgi:hypothetical protein
MPNTGFVSPLRGYRPPPSRTGIPEGGKPGAGKPDRGNKGRGNGRGLGGGRPSGGGGGGGGGGPPVVTGTLTYASAADFGSNQTSYTTGALAIGAADPDRWVVVGIYANFNTARALAGVTIGGVAATLMHGFPVLTATGARAEYWKAKVPTGTTAVVVIPAASGLIWDGAVGVWVASAEPFFSDAGFDNTFTGTTFTTAVDVPDGGAIIALSNDTGGSGRTVTSISGVVLDWTSLPYSIAGASQDELALQAARSVSMTWSVASSVPDFFGLSALAITFQPTYAPTIETANQSVQNTSGTTSGAVSSGSPSEGELVILHLATGDNTAAASFTWPSGFVEGGRHAAGGSTRGEGVWAYKEAGASEPSTYTVTWSAGSSRSVLSCVVLSGHGGIGGFVSNVRSSNQNDHTSPAFQSVASESLRLAFFNYGWGGGTMTAVTVPTLSPAIQEVLPPVMADGDDTTGCGTFVQSRVETADIYPAYTNVMSWSGNGGGIHYQCFTIAIKGFGPS